MYAVVEFLDGTGGSCEVVPLKWVSGDYKTCKWPNRNVKKAVESGSIPDQSWESFRIKLVYFAGKIMTCLKR